MVFEKLSFKDSLYILLFLLIHQFNWIYFVPVVVAPKHQVTIVNFTVPFDSLVILALKLNM